MDIFYLLASERSLEFLRLVEKIIDRRLVKQHILKKTSDRTFMLRKSSRVREKHRCLIYRRLKSLKEQDINAIFEDIPTEQEEDTEILEQERATLEDRRAEQSP